MSSAESAGGPYLLVYISLPLTSFQLKSILQTTIGLGLYSMHARSQSCPAQLSNQTFGRQIWKHSSTENRVLPPMTSSNDKTYLCTHEPECGRVELVCQ